MPTKLSRSGLLLGALVSSAQGPTLEVRNPSGARIASDAKDRNPEILFPEHVTVRAHGQTEPTHLYVFHPGWKGDSPRWTKVRNALEYSTDFGEIHFVARASLVDDGIVFRYEIHQPLRH